MILPKYYIPLLFFYFGNYNKDINNKTEEKIE